LGDVLVILRSNTPRSKASGKASKGCFEEEEVMKNNGRKIFFAIVFAALSSLPLIVMAGSAVVTRK
jgi:hypothetical protein